MLSLLLLLLQLVSATLPAAQSTTALFIASSASPVSAPIVNPNNVLPTAHCYVLALGSSSLGDHISSK